MATSRTIEALRVELTALEEDLRQQERRRVRERERLQARIDVLAEHAATEAHRADRLRLAIQSLEVELGAIRDRLKAAEREGRGLEADAARAQRAAERQDELVARQSELIELFSGAVAQVKDDVERVAVSRAWRTGHRLALAADRLRMRRRVTQGAVAQALTRLNALESKVAALTPATIADPENGPSIAAELDAAAREQLARQIRTRLGAAPRRTRWPKVSIVVCNRNGEAHLRRLFAGLENHTDYPRFELIVVDNASSDDSRRYLRTAEPRFKLTVLENKVNASFAEANGQGARAANGELLLFLNNDIEPFERGWLRELVALSQRRGVGVAGATLIHAGEYSGGIPLVQHRGIRIRAQRGRLFGYNLDDGGLLFSDRFGADVEAPATTGACLMMSRRRFEAIGGFPVGYRYGTEDVDLGLQVVASRETVMTSGRAHLLHRESSTQNAEGRAFMRENRLANQQLFAERWASRLRREYRLGRLRGDRFWTEGERPHIVLTLTSLEQSDGWGDWYTGHELGEALVGLGWQVSYVQRKEDQWYTLPDGADYLLVLLDAYDLSRVNPDVTTIAWVRNWTERWLERSSFAAYDLVLASSLGSLELIERRTGVKAELFPLATSLERFQRTVSDPNLSADFVFTGNHWNRPREIQSIALRPQERLKVFGSGWEQVPELAPYAQGSVPYDRLPAVYSSARIVVDDTAEHALPYGAVNSRVFDALACGTVVASNCERGVRELFDDEFPTWHDQSSLRARLDELLGDDQRREELVRRYQQMVRERHTYELRAQRLATVLEQREAQLTFCIKTGAPSRAVAAEWGDVHFGEALARELRRRGHRTIVQVLDEWEHQLGHQFDVVVHLRGLSRYTPKSGQFNVLWCISHPAEVTAEECDSYDLVCVASERFAATLRPRVHTPVIVLEQATDPRLFYPENDRRYEHELAFVANSRKVMRRIIADVIPTDHDLAVYGTNWRGLIDERYIAGEHVPNRELRKVYSSAAIVLNDHWDDMREHGFVSNRIYDALACGALVLSDDLPELADRFGDSVVTYTDADQLPGLIKQLLSSPDERAQRGRRGREAVLATHTFAHRVDELLSAVTERADPPRLIRPGAGQSPRAPLRRRRRTRTPAERAA